jgi:hypothetical protein
LLIDKTPTLITFSVRYLVVKLYVTNTYFTKTLFFITREEVPQDVLYKIINPLNGELNPIRHLLTLVGARHFVYVSRIKINITDYLTQHCYHIRPLTT